MYSYLAGPDVSKSLKVVTRGEGGGGKRRDPNMGRGDKEVRRGWETLGREDHHRVVNRKV